MRRALLGRCATRWAELTSAQGANRRHAALTICNVEDHLSVFVHPGRASRAGRYDKDEFLLGQRCAQETGYTPGYRPASAPTDSGKQVSELSEALTVFRPLASTPEMRMDFYCSLATWMICQLEACAGWQAIH